MKKNILLLSAERGQIAQLLFLSCVILFGQIEAEVFYSVDGIVYALVGKELAARPIWEWVQLT